MDVQVSSTPLKIRQLADLKKTGRLHLPDLQRGFVWDAERVRMLFDSLVRRYPVGALLLWEPAWEGEDPPVQTRPWDLAPPRATDEVGQPEAAGQPRPGSFFVLDGQQRLTSLFRVIFDSREPGKSARDPELLVSLSRDVEWAESPFLFRNRHIARERERDGIIIPASLLFEGVRTGTNGGRESESIARAIARWFQPGDSRFYEAVDRANELRNAVLYAELGAYEIRSQSEDDTDHVIEIFGRLNQQAVRLSTADLAAARLTGVMSDFRRTADAALRQPAMRGFTTVEGEDAKVGGFVDTDLIVRTSMCLETRFVKYKDAESRRPDRRSKLYEQIKTSFPVAADALQRTVEDLRQSGIPSGRWLPYRYLLLPPAIARARPGGSTPGPSAWSHDQWLGWTLCASLWSLYAGSSETKVQADAQAVLDGDTDRLWQHLRKHARRPNSLVPEAVDLRQGLVQAAGVHLVQLVHMRGRDAWSYPSRARIWGAEPKLDVHHIFPRALWSGRGRRGGGGLDHPDRIGNLDLILADDNSALGAPTDIGAYLNSLSAPVRVDHAIPDDTALWHPDRYLDFCEAREELLTQRVREELLRLGVD